MEIKEITYLIALAEEGSISKAAERLYMAQSSLSQFLAQYEHELGVKLFFRTARGIMLTPNGEIYLDRLRKMDAYYQRAQNELHDNENMMSGQITLGISSFRGNRTLPLILNSFYEKYPHVKVKVTEANISVLEDELLAGTVDLALIAMPSTKIKHEVRLLYRDEIFLIVPRYHPVMRKAHYKEDGHGMWIDLKDTVDYNYIFSDYDTVLGKFARNIFKREHLHVHTIHDNITARMSATMAMEGVGLAFSYASCILPGDKYELLSVGEQGEFLNLGIANPTSEYHSQAAMKMEEVIREVYVGLKLE